MVLKKITSATGFFRKMLSMELTLRKVPNLIFVKDNASENYEIIEDILKKIKEQ